MKSIIYSEEHSHIVSQLRKARIEAGLSQKQAAKLLGKTQSYISKIESGQRRLDVIQLKKFALVYEKPMDYFIGG